MANTKQKPTPEGATRSPGKSRFSIPQREAPPIDGSYLDRLFADYKKQSQELENKDPGAAASAESSSLPAEIGKEVAPETAPSLTSESVRDTPPLASSVTQPQLPDVEARSATIQQPSTSEPSPQPSPAGARRTHRAAPVAETPAPPPSEFPRDDTVFFEKLKKKHRLGKGEINVLKAMIHFCQESGADYCYIKIPQLMAASGLKERQTQVVLRNLREMELIEKLADYSNIDRLGTKYKVNFVPF